MLGQAYHLCQVHANVMIFRLLMLTGLHSPLIYLLALKMSSLALLPPFNIHHILSSISHGQCSYWVAMTGSASMTLALSSWMLMTYSKSFSLSSIQLSGMLFLHSSNCRPCGRRSGICHSMHSMGEQYRKVLIRLESITGNLMINQSICSH